MTTYDVLAAEVKSRVGNRGDIDARLPLWVNDAYFELLMEPEFVFHELERSYTLTTILGLREYNLMGLIPDLWHILGLRDITNNREIRRTHWKVFDRLATTIGQPFRYSRFRDNLILDPTPDATYSILVRYNHRPNTLVPNVGSTSILGREWDEIIIVKATRKAYEALEQQEKASQTATLETLLLDSRKEMKVLEDEDNENSITLRKATLGGIY